MRIFFLFLLILNALFAAWQFYTPREVSTYIEPLPENLDRLVLLKEVALEPEPVVAEVIEVDGVITEEQPEIREPEKKCYTLGPYTDRGLVSQIESQIINDVLDFQVREREEQELHRYWVHLPPYNNRNDARKASRELAKKNVKDYYIIQKGDAKNSISLGHFREKANADVRVKKVSRLGFNPEIEVIYRKYNIYWLDYSLQGAHEDVDTKIGEYLVDGVTLLDRECE